MSSSAAPAPPAARAVLLHGAATTAAVWGPVLAHLGGITVLAPERPSSGDLETEVAWALPLVDGALVVGVGGGATLGLALAARTDVRLSGALLHEPAVGSLVPGLLAPMAEAYVSGGVPAFAATLYGPRWTESLAPDDEAAVARDLAMFRAFEPAPVAAHHGRVVVTVGELSPQIRHRAATAAGELGALVEVVPGAGHFVHHEQPQRWAALVRRDLLR